MINMADDYLNIQEDEKEIWKVENDLSADWCLDKIRESKAEYNRFEIVANAKIQQIEQALQKEKEKMKNETGFFETKLREYFEIVKTKDTKTLKKYKLPSGELKLKKAKTTFKYDKNKLVEIADEHENMKDYIKIKKDFNWSDFKKKLMINGKNIIDKDTGEVIEVEGLTIEEKPEEFNVEV